jgi:hypothetical protein
MIPVEVTVGQKLSKNLGRTGNSAEDHLESMKIILIESDLIKPLDYPQYGDRGLPSLRAANPVHSRRLANFGGSTMI